MHVIRLTTLVVLQLVLHLSLIIAPDADFAVCVGVIILQVLHLALPHGSCPPAWFIITHVWFELPTYKKTLGSSVGHGRSFCKDLAQSARGLNDVPVFVDDIPHFWQVWEIRQHEGENARLGFRPIRK